MDAPFVLCSDNGVLGNKIQYLKNQAEYLTKKFELFTKEQEQDLIADIQNDLNLDEYRGQLFHLDFKRLNFSSFRKKYHLVFITYNSFFEIAHNIYQAEKALKTIRKILEPGGFLIIQNDNPNCIDLTEFFFRLSTSSPDLIYEMHGKELDTFNNLLRSEERILTQSGELITTGDVRQKWWTPNEMVLLAQKIKFRKTVFYHSDTKGKFENKEHLGEYFMVTEK
jgi:SAM-dependent methyltransferase